MQRGAFDGSCSTRPEAWSPAAPPPALDPAEVVWFDDAPPAGAQLGGGPWMWDSDQKASGASSHHQPPAYGMHEHYLWDTPAPFAVQTGDTLITYVYLDPCSPPREVMLAFRTGTTWEQRAYWGEDLITAWGTNGTPSRLRVGELPPTGGWVRLEVAARSLGLEGKTVNGVSFLLFSGHAWFDRTGKIPAASGAGDEAGVESQQAGPGTDALRGDAGYDPISLLIGADMLESVGAASSGGSQRVSIYLPELQLLTESEFTTGTPLPAWDYVWFAGQPLAQIEVATGAIRWTFNDHLGTPLLQTDATGAVVWRLEQEPYGAEVAFRAGLGAHQPLRFPGQEAEPDSERSYNVFRWYRGGWGRYTQADPIGLKGGLNLFAYVSGNPVRFIDARGLVRWMCDYGYATAELPGGGPGVGIFYAKCVSDCVAGKRVSTTILSGLGGASVGSPVPFTIAFSRAMEVNDSFSKPNASNLEGVIAFTSVGGALGVGGSCTALKVGSAFGMDCSGQAGIGLGWDSFGGLGAAFNTSTTCCSSSASGQW